MLRRMWLAPTLPSHGGALGRTGLALARRRAVAGLRGRWVARVLVKSTEIVQYSGMYLCDNGYRFCIRGTVRRCVRHAILFRNIGKGRRNFSGSYFWLLFIRRRRTPALLDGITFARIFGQTHSSSLKVLSDNYERASARLNRTRAE